MDKILKAAASVAEQVFTEYAQRGGVIRDGDRVLSVSETASVKGVLVALLWMLREFIDDYEIDFPVPVYVADPDTLLGVSVESLDVSRSASPSIFMLSDFLRNEIVPQDVSNLDLSLLLANFREWAVQNVPGASMIQVYPGQRKPE